MRKPEEKGSGIRQGPFPATIDKTAYIRSIYRKLKQTYGPARCPLHFKKPHELAIAVILSAQCTDEQVNRTTPALFERFPEAIDYTRGRLVEIEKLIYSTGFYRAKARSIQGFCSTLINKHSGQLPDTIAELTRMPGIGRKTANVILGEIFKKAEGITVDTHVKRISSLLGLSSGGSPVQIEKELMGCVPEPYWLDFSLYLIFLGRSSCKARRPDCHSCPIGDICIASMKQTRKA